MGQSVDILLRWAQHKAALRSGSHDSKLMQRDWFWFRWAFTFKVLEVAEDNLNELEEKWIIRKNAEYNTCWPGGRDFIERANGRVMPRIKPSKHLQWWQWAIAGLWGAIAISLLTN